MGYFLGKEELDVALRESRKNMEEGVYDSAPSEVRERAPGANRPHDASVPDG